MNMNLPNIMTLARILAIPFIIGLLYMPQGWAVWASCGLFIMAAVTDFFDGWYARKMNIVTDFGRFLDPIADKVLVGCLIVVLAAVDRLDGFWVISAVLILAREFLVAGLREYLGPKNITIHVTQMAKWKTTVQMVALGFLIVGDAGDVIIPHTLLIGQVGLSLAALMTVITGWNYIVVGIGHMKD
jgi:cardiolipin synthase